MKKERGRKEGKKRGKEKKGKREGEKRRGEKTRQVGQINESKVASITIPVHTFKLLTVYF